MTGVQVSCKTCGQPAEAVPNPDYGQRLSAPQMIATCPEGHRTGYSPVPPHDPRLTRR